MTQLDKENKNISQTLAVLQEKAVSMEQRIKEGEKEYSSATRIIECEMAVLTELSQKLSYPRRMLLKDILFSKSISTELSLKPLSPSFWKDLLMLADLKTNGVITYLNENYNCKPKEIHFIALVSLGFSNQIIQHCQNYSNVNTVKNYKSGIIKKITGENKSIGSFIEEYTKNH